TALAHRGLARRLRARGRPPRVRAKFRGDVCMPLSAAAGIALDEALIFERGSPGRTGVSAPAPDVPEADPKALFGAMFRDEAQGPRGLAGPAAFGHSVRLRQQTYHTASLMYPIGWYPMK